MVRNSSGRLFQYLGAATVKAASAYIDDTSGRESFISSQEFHSANCDSDEYTVRNKWYNID